MEDPNNKYQKLFIGDSTQPVLAVRTYKRDINSALIIECADGRWMYAGGQLIKDASELEDDKGKMFIPEPHLTRVLNWIEQGKSSDKRHQKVEDAGKVSPKDAEANIGLMKHTKEDLALMAGVTDGQTYSKADLVKLVMKKAAEKEHAEQK